MKKIFAILMAVMMIASFAACKDGSTDTTEAVQSATVNVDVTGVVKEDAADVTSDIVELAGERYKFPMKVSELIDDGWRFYDHVLERLAPVDPQVETQLSSISLYHKDRGGMLTLISVFNPSDKEAEIVDSYLVWFNIGDVNFLPDTVDDFDFALPGGITENSTAADVLRIYGEPDNAPNFSTATFDGSAAEYMSEEFLYNFTFDNDGSLSNVSMRSSTVPAE